MRHPNGATVGPLPFDLRSGELQKQGRKIRLEGQPVQVLMCLLENPGELVTREELHRKLWPEDTFVNFEHGLNAAVKRLRQALNDSADNPRFVETLPRRGYRFIAPIQVVSGNVVPGSEAVPTPSAANPLPEGIDQEQVDSSDTPLVSEPSAPAARMEDARPRSAPGARNLYSRNDSLQEPRARHSISCGPSSGKPVR